MSGSTLYFSGKISGYPVAFTLRAVAAEDRLRLDYGFGLYHHLLEVDSLGYCTDIVLRDKKVLFQHSAYPDESFKYDKQVNPQEGRTLNYYPAKLLVGAGNGLLGFGITKPEWLEGCTIYILVTQHGFYKFSVESAVEGCLLLVSLNPKERSLDIRESPALRHIKN
jgi:hypothetical protein